MCTVIIVLSFTFWYIPFVMISEFVEKKKKEAEEVEQATETPSYSE